MVRMSGGPAGTAILLELSNPAEIWGIFFQIKSPTVYMYIQFYINIMQISSEINVGLAHSARQTLKSAVTRKHLSHLMLINLVT